MGVLRFLLALSVIVAHSSAVLGFKMLPASHAVGTFFVLAGFLACYVMEVKYKGDYKSFYLNRAIRLWPLYWLVMAGSACVLVAGLYIWHRPLGPLDHWFTVIKLPPWPWMGAFAFSQVFCVGQDLIAFSNVTREGELVWGVCPPDPEYLLNLFNLNLLPTAWSLAVEEYFYMVAPLLKGLGMGWSGAVFLAGLALSSFKISCENLAPGFYPPTISFFFGGIFAYRLYALLQQRGATTQRLHRWLAWGFLGFIVLAGFAPFPVPRALTVAFAALALPSLFIVFKDRPWDRYLGDLSYPLYLVHMPVIWAVDLSLPYYRANATDGLLVVPISILASVIIAHAVERPLRRFRDRLVERRRSALRSAE